MVLVRSTVINSDVRLMVNNPASIKKLLKLHLTSKLAKKNSSSSDLSCFFSILTLYLECVIEEYFSLPEDEKKDVKSAFLKTMGKNPGIIDDYPAWCLLQTID